MADQQGVTDTAPGIVTGTRGRHYRRNSRQGRVILVTALICAGLVGSAVLYTAGTAVRINNNVHRSDALIGLPAQHQVPKLTQDTNILIMGLDSRVDENGKPLPAELYDALHAGDENVGGYNSNVLMLVHIPADGSRSTAISIPRDDYVQLAGVPGGSPMAKIKEAYGYALAAEMTRLIAAGKPDDDGTYQIARDAGRTAEIATVTQFLGGVHIDHFVEVTMAAFYQTAQAIAPITVCVNRTTQDTYSGADFKAGVQQIDAKQAMAFVRQRRDTSDPSYNFSDLDRERRQQAFIASVLHQLKQVGTLTDVGKMQSVLDAVSKNIVVDSGLNLIEFAQQAASLTGGNIDFTTLPITGFATAPNGESINTVNLQQVQDATKQLLSPPAQAPPATATATGSPSAAAPASQTAASPPATAATPSPTPNTYANWTGALQGGNIPCVK